MNAPRLLFQLLLCCTALCASLLSGCASKPADRVEKKAALVASWPSDIQNKVKAGQVEVGYTKDQVWVALGDPDRIYTRTSTEGNTEVWAYLSHAPKFSFGVGVGSAGGGSAMGGSVMVSPGQDHDDELKRVIFRNDLVQALEESKK